MNTYTKSTREQRRINREHFIMYHWIHFSECRKWSLQDWQTRLKAEGLLAKSTYHADTPTLLAFLNALWNRHDKSL